jgi:phosphatidate cytidylyltransferase
MNNELKKRIISSFILTPIVFFSIIKGSYIFISLIFICFLISVYEWNMMSKYKLYKIPGFIFIILSFFTIHKLRINLENDFWYFIIVILICIGSDIGGYLFGNLFKGPKLSKFSPKKTYSGMIGAFILPITLIIILKNYIVIEAYLNINWIIFVILISLTSQLGDIIISYFKRLSKIKDTGKIIPGHGGLLDRIDGMIFAFPLSYIIQLINFI